ncbi:MAG: VOC family protein [Opitutaceae bacterium]|nr:VOC family protein [Opitutaceae bacterium]
MKITAIAFVGYPVTDMARARAFYEKLLGLKPGEIWEHEGKAWVEFDIGSGTLALSNMSPDKWKPSPDGPGVALEVDDLESAVRELKSAGVRFYLDPMDSPVCRLAVVADPDGNSVVLHQKAKAPAS